MKVTSFHFMPYRELPDDVERRYRSLLVDAPWSELGDAQRPVEARPSQLVTRLLVERKSVFRLVTARPAFVQRLRQQLRVAESVRDAVTRDWVSQMSGVAD